MQNNDNDQVWFAFRELFSNEVEKPICAFVRLVISEGIFQYLREKSHVTYE